MAHSHTGTSGLARAGCEMPPVRESGKTQTNKQPFKQAGGYSTSLQGIEPVFLLAPVERKADGLLVHSGPLLATIVPRLVHHPLPLPALRLAPAAHLAVVVLLDATLHLARIRLELVGVGWGGVGGGVRFR